MGKQLGQPLMHVIILVVVMVWVRQAPILLFTQEATYVTLDFFPEVHIDLIGHIYTLLMDSGL